MDPTSASRNDEGDHCDICAHPIIRDVFQDNSSNVVTSGWLGVCGCATRKWTSRSETGEPPWALVDSVGTEIRTP